MRRSWIVAGVAAVLAAQEPAGLVSGPVLGLVPDGGGYRVLRGAPGSLEFGEAVALPSGTVSARVAPRQEWLLIERETGIEAFDWRRGRSLAIKAAKGARAAFSPSGVDLALYDGPSGNLTVFTGLPGEARVIREERRGELGEGVNALAVSDGGGEVVALTASGRLLRLAAGGGEEIHRSDDISSFAFLPGRVGLIVGDRIQNAVLAIEPEAGAWRSRVLLSAADGLDDPDGVWAGAAGRIVVGSYKRGQAWIFDGARWTIENIEGLQSIDELQLRDTLLAGGSLVALGSAEQRVYRLPRREQ